MFKNYKIQIFSLVTTLVFANSCFMYAQSGDKFAVDKAEALFYGGFDVAYDAKRNLLHFAYRDVHVIYYTSSPDYGKTWTNPSIVARDALNPVLRVDSEGTLHMAFTRYYGEHDDSDGIIYTYLKNNQWAPYDTVYNQKGFNETAPRFAIDKNDNIHLLLWSFSWPENPENECLLYFKKEKSQDKFSKPEFWCADKEESHYRTSHSAIDADSQGNIHIVTGYLAAQKNTDSHAWSLQYRKLNANGTWDIVKNFNQMANDNHAFGDNSFDIVAHDNGKVYMSAFSSWGHWDTGLHGTSVWSYTPGADSLVQEFFVEEYWEPNTKLFLNASGDVYMASGNCGWKSHDTREQYRASYFHYSAAIGNWGNRVHVSENPLALNVNTKFDMNPKWVKIGEGLFIVYAEKTPGELVKYYFKKVN